jgi:GGDEF domain-containing protein
MSTQTTVIANVPLVLPSTVNHDQAAIAACTEDYTFIAANQLMADFYGMQARDLIGRSVFEFYPQFKTSVFYDGARDTIQSGKKTARIGYSSNTKRWLLVKTFMAGDYPVLSAEPMLHNTDIILESELDSMTSLKNIFALDVDLEDMLAEKIKFGLVLFKVKSLNQITDVYDDHVVDRCLMQIAARIRSSTSSINQVYRIDEDLFVMVVPTNFGANAVNLEVHRALSAISQPFAIDQATINVEMAYGVCLDTTLSGSDMLSAAKLAMNQ